MILDGIKINKDAWEEVKQSILIGAWKKLIPNMTDDSEGFQHPVDKIQKLTWQGNQNWKSSPKTCYRTTRFS